MALVRKDRGEIQFKIVYCGPPRGGKTTNLLYIHRRLDSHHRGDMVSVETEQNRTISFDFLPVQSTKVAGYRIKFQLYTVPGQQLMRKTRSAVLAGTDAVVFVADSDPERRAANIESFEDMRSCLRENQIAPDSIPTVFQYNKRDMAEVTPPEELDELFQVTTGTFLACATSGYQVFATLDRVTRMILQEFLQRNVLENTCHGDEVSEARSPALSR
ncbi:MAG: GTPase domain-containing protein [Verrucomicrobiota bacterium]